MPALLGGNSNRVVPSPLAMDLKGMGYDIITWTFERADLRGGASRRRPICAAWPTGWSSRRSRKSSWSRSESGSM
jgi:hypothetical protein